MIEVTLTEGEVILIVDALDIMAHHPLMEASIREEASELANRIKALADGADPWGVNL